MFKQFAKGVGRVGQISKTASIAPTAVLSSDVFVGENVVIEDDVFVDIGCIIRDNVHIGRGSRIGAHCILGEYQQDFYTQLKAGYHPLKIGNDALIRSGTIIYGDTVIGDHFQTGHRVTIREKTDIGHHVRIGTLSDIQGYCTIESYVNLHSNVHVSQKSVIHQYVWMFPYVVLTNDPQPPSEQLKGVEIDEFAVVCTGTVVLPGVHIGKDALIGAVSVVTKDVLPESVAYGNPAKRKCAVQEVLNSHGEAAYPWRNHFDRGMPWAGLGYEKWHKSRLEMRTDED